MYGMVLESTPVGRLTLASDGEALTGLWLEGQKYFGLPGGAALVPATGELPAFRAARVWLEVYFAGGDPGPAEQSVPLAPAGTAFQRAVWEQLLQIPYGRTATYGHLARRLEQSLGRSPVSPRAVGSAVGRNPISILIPCHRVVGAGGSLTGYAGGLERKARLLEREGVDPSRPLAVRCF